MSTAAHLGRVEHVRAPDGWDVCVEISTPPSPVTGAALLVPAAKHERDAWGPTLTSALLERGLVVMATDIRGRGDSRRPAAMMSLPPAHRRAVRDDVRAAVDLLAEQPGVSPGSIVVFGEQDTSDAAATVALGDPRVGRLVLVSPRLAAATVDLARASQTSLCVVASKEDRIGLERAVALYARARDARSRLRLVRDVGSGTTMFAAWQYLHPGEPTLEHWLASWATWR